MNEAHYHDVLLLITTIGFTVSVALTIVIALCAHSQAKCCFLLSKRLCRQQNDDSELACGTAMQTCQRGEK